MRALEVVVKVHSMISRTKSVAESNFQEIYNFESVEIVLALAQSQKLLSHTSSIAFE